MCTKIAIMAKGQIRALGSRQYLKSQFGAYCEMHIKLHYTENLNQIIQSLYTDMSSNFENLQAISQNGTFLVYRIPKANITLSGFFNYMEMNKELFSIEYYGLDQPSLEQVFIETVSPFHDKPDTIIHCVDSITALSISDNNGSNNNVISTNIRERVNNGDIETSSYQYTITNNNLNNDNSPLSIGANNDHTIRQLSDTQSAPSVINILYDDLYYTGSYNDFGCTKIVVKMLNLTFFVSIIIFFVLSIYDHADSIIWFTMSYTCLLIFMFLVFVFIWTYRRNIWSVFQL